MNDIKIVGVYNANSGIIGELKYVTGKILKITSCELCDITHGFSVKEKKEWAYEIVKCPYTIETVYLNEMDEKIKKIATGNTPVVIVFKGEKGEILFTKEELRTINKDPKEFFKRLYKKLENI